MAMLSIEEPLEVDAEALKQKIDALEDFVLLDVRAPLECKAWPFEYAGVAPIPLPLQDLFTQPESILSRIPPNKEVLVVCAHGNRSLVAAQLLSSLGYRAKSVRGGMNQLNGVCDIAQLWLEEGSLAILQLRRILKGCVGYIVASHESGEALIVDPQHACHPSYIEQVRRLGVKVKAIVETHTPLDHVSGAPILSRLLGAQTVRLGGSEGKEITVGGLKLEPAPLNLPTQKPALLYLEGEKRPLTLFSGDTLFLEGYGRPDGYSPIEKVAEALYEMYEWVFTKLPEDLLVLPSHSLPASLAKGKPYQATVKELKERLWSPKPQREGFLDLLLAHTPPKPANHEIIAEINRSPEKHLAYINDWQIRELESGQNNMIVEYPRKNRPTTPKQKSLSLDEP